MAGSAVGAATVPVPPGGLVGRETPLTTEREVLVVPWSARPVAVAVVPSIGLEPLPLWPLFLGNKDGPPDAAAGVLVAKAGEVMGARLAPEEGGLAGVCVAYLTGPLRYTLCCLDGLALLSTAGRGLVLPVQLANESVAWPRLCLGKLNWWF
jgi:hypothetical protein